MEALIIPIIFIFILLFYVIFESNKNKKNMMNYIKKLGIELIIAVVVMVLFVLLKQAWGFETATMISISTIISKIIYSESIQNK